MGDRFTKAMTQLNRCMKRDVGVSVTYNRYIDENTVESIPLTKFWVGKTAFRISDSGRSRIIWSDRDYMVPVADLADGDGNLFIPAKGDWIEESLPNPVSTVRYEVFAPNDEQIFRYSDATHMLYRIHTKRV